MAQLTEVSDSTFEAEVINVPDPVLVDFGADWCHPCRQLDPIVEGLAVEWRGRVKIVHVDADQNIDSTMRFQVMGLPTLILFLHGQPVARLQGFQPKKRIVEAVEPHLAPAQG